MYASADDELGKQLRSNVFSLSGTGFFGAVGRSINLGKNKICLSRLSNITSVKEFYLVFM